MNGFDKTMLMPDFASEEDFNAYFKKETDYLKQFRNENGELCIAPGDLSGVLVGLFGVRGIQSKVKDSSDDLIALDVGPF